MTGTLDATALQSVIDAHVADGLDRRDPEFRRIVMSLRRMRREMPQRIRRTARQRLEDDILAPLRRELGTLRIVAIDTEWSTGGAAFDELGIAVWNRGAMLGPVNIRTMPKANAETSAEDPRMHTVGEALNVLRKALQGADRIAMHAGGNDRRRLEMAGFRLPHVEGIDTLTWHRMATGERDPASLTRVCARLDVRHEGRHVASNDAQATLDCVMRMIEDGPGPSFPDPRMTGMDNAAFPG